MHRVQLKLLIDNQEIETVSIEKRHILAGNHSKKELVNIMVDRITNFIEQKGFDPGI